MPGFGIRSISLSLDNMPGEDQNKTNDGVMLMCMYRGPGPAAYKLKTLVGREDHCKTKVQAPAYSIGIPYKYAPGPQYVYDPLVTARGRQEAPRHTITGRPRTQGSEQLPGPAEYEVKPAKDGIPRISIGLPIPSPFKKDAPAPNSYTIKSGIGTKSMAEPSSPEILVRSRTFVGSPYHNVLKSNVPGPATYGPPDHRVVYPNLGGPYTLKSRLNYRDNPIDGQWERMPGPGAYNPNDRVLSTRDRGAGKSGFSMGVRHSRYVMPLITGADMYY